MFLKKDEKKSCWSCGSIEVIGWGNRNDKQRFKCKNCGILFTNTNKGVSEANRFIWFRKWVLERQIISDISKESGYSARTLKNYFGQYLEKAPVWKVYPSKKVNLLIDGTYFSNDLCLVLYRDNTIKFTQLYRLTDGERYQEMKEDLENLLLLGVQIESITCDGHRALLKAIKKVCGHTIIQRCVVHIQRSCLIWLRQKPKTEPGSELKSIVSRLHTIKTSLQRDYWIVDLIKWHEKHQDFINEKSYKETTKRYWYKHKAVRRCFMSLKKALPDMFHYIEHPQIPKSTNGLESFFGHLKGHLSIHRGMSKEHRKNYIKWYLHLKNN